ncbi:MAG: hypothetical protein AAGJ87_16345 [Pseudomonadota bacterium]
MAREELLNAGSDDGDGLKEGVSSKEFSDRLERMRRTVENKRSR